MSDDASRSKEIERIAFSNLRPVQVGLMPLPSEEEVAQFWAMLQDLHDMQVKLAKEGNPFAQSYMLRCAGYGHLIDGPEYNENSVEENHHDQQ